MTKRDLTTVLSLRPRAGFVETPFVTDLTERAVAYVRAGFPVHFQGPSGSGKTTLAMHLAHCLARPIMLICGDDSFGSADLVGAQNGFHRRRVIDNFVHSVLKTEEDMQQRWVDNRLTAACREGFTLIYDEFARSRPEANNVLLSVLEERILVLPTSRSENGYIKVHPQFSAIFTSNPQDYAGVHRTQDALRDRMLTIAVDFFDRPTEIEITQARSGIGREDAERIVDLVRVVRESGVGESSPTVRSCIMIARVLQLRAASACAGDQVFEQTCLDVLAGGAAMTGPRARDGAQWRSTVQALVQEHCRAGSGSAAQCAS